MLKITFTELEKWQNKHCLYCGDSAVQQATAKEGENGVAIRCCLKENCKKQAEQAAKEIITKLRKNKRATQ